MIDAVIPNNNEKEFVEIADKLGYGKIIFLYANEKNIPHITSDKIKIIFGVINIKGGKGKHLTFMQSGENDQHIIEHNPPNAVFGFEAKAEKDYLHQRASGLNNVICTFAQKNKVVIAFSFNQILKNFRTKRAQVFGRMMQNIKLCRKHKVTMCIASFAKDPFEMRAPKELSALFQLLGMHQEEARKAMNAFE